MSKIRVVKCICDFSGEEFEEGAEGSAKVRVEIAGEDVIHVLDAAPSVVKDFPRSETPRKKREPKETEAKAAKAA